MNNTPEYNRCGNNADNVIDMTVLGMLSSIANAGMKSSVTDQ